MTTSPPQPRTPNLLRSLRALIPARDTTFTEAMCIAEIQARRLLRLLASTGTLLPETMIARLPKIRVEYITELPSCRSGLSFWNGQTWIIQVSSRQTPARQRFALLREYKQIIDYGATDRLYPDNPEHSGRQKADRAADYFASCVLIPRRVITAAWTDGIRDPGVLVDYFGVTERQIEMRRDQAGRDDHRYQDHAKGSRAVRTKATV